MERSRAAVLEAGLALLAEEGVRGCTIDAVVARSGVAKTTIYRQWASRDELLGDLFANLDSHRVTPDTGSLRADLRVLLRELAHELANADWAKGLTAIVSEAEHDPALAAGHRDHVELETRPLREILERARSRGELAPGTDLNLAVELIGGALFYRRLVLHSSTSRREVDRLVDLLLDGLQAR